MDLAFFLSFGGGMTSFPLEPVSLGDMSFTSSVGHFSQIITPFVAEVGVVTDLHHPI